MPNQGDYFTEGFTGQPRGLVKVEQMDNLEARIAAAFNLLPGIRELLEDRVTAYVATTSNGLAFTVTMDPAPVQYTEGMALQVRFPQDTQANATLDIIGADGMSLGPKPIRDVNRERLTAGHITAGARVELYYVVLDNGYWSLGAGGARGPVGQAGPPDGEFYVIANTKQIGFRTLDGTPIHNFGPFAPTPRGPYDAATTYSFLDVAQAGGKLYIHLGYADTTGTAVTDTSVWFPILDIANTVYLDAAAVGGTANAITLTPDPAITSYEADQRYRFIVKAENTGAVTVDVNGQGAKAITKEGTTALDAGDLKVGMIVTLMYDGTQFQALGLSSTPPSGTVFVPASGVAQSGNGNGLITLTPDPAATEYEAGDAYEFVLENDISANASINVSSLGSKNLSFSASSRVSSLKAGNVIRAIYDGTRFLLGSLAAAVLSATMVEFTASNPAYAWPYAATKAVAVIEGAGGGGGGGSAAGSFGAFNYDGGDGGDHNMTAPTLTGNTPAGRGGDGGEDSSVTVGAETVTAEGGGGGGGGEWRFGRNGGGGDGGGETATSGDGGSGDAVSGVGGTKGLKGASGDFQQQDGSDGGSGQLKVKLFTGLQVGTVFNIVVGEGGDGGDGGDSGFPSQTAPGGDGGDGNDGKVTLYPLWA